mmetsp:Transcript_4189/g.10921  ORF Transcript_4189/g.10921 Transcript_4189/m.10921 type:complete len:180 (-) Transcript_4189:169-708(-)
MAALSLAVIGKDKEPMYMRDFDNVNQELAEEELFGFAPSVGGSTTAECSIRNQFLFHGALDRFEQLAGPPPGLQWRRPGTTGSDAMFVGLLCPVEDTRIYGYMTTTKILFLLIVDDDTVPEHQANVDSEIQRLMSQIHGLYIEYNLNPFSNIESKITSKRFDDGVQKFVAAFNDSDAMI